MGPYLEKLLDITKRSDAISGQTKIAMLEFSAATEASDPKKQEEARTKLHQLIDDQLDLQVEIQVFKEHNEASILERFKHQFK